MQGWRVAVRRVVVFLCVVDISADQGRRTGWKSPNLPLFLPFLFISTAFSVSAHCWPQSHSTLSLLTDAEEPVRGWPEDLQLGTDRGGPLVGRARPEPEPESGESSPPSPPPPLPSTPRQGQRKEAEVPGQSNHCAAVEHCRWVTEETAGFYQCVCVTISIYGWCFTLKWSSWMLAEEIKIMTGLFSDITNSFVKAEKKFSKK